MAEQEISVEVVYAGEGQVVRRTFTLSAGSTVREAVEASGIRESLPPRLLDSAPWGIFSRRVSSDHLVLDGDRIEIYRRLITDPMDARRRRAG